MATQTHSPFETLARVIEHLDDGNRSVRRTEAGGADEAGSLRATVVVSVGAPLGEGSELEPEAATIDDGLSMTVRAPSFPDPAAVLPAGYPEVSATPTDVRCDGGAVVVTLEVTIGSDDRPAGAIDASGDESMSASAGNGSTEASGGSGSTGASGSSESTTTSGGSGSTTASSGGSTTASSSGSTAASGSSGSEAPSSAATFGGRNATAGVKDRNAGSGSAESSSTEADDSGSETGDTGGSDDPSPLAAVRDESVPPYDDVPYLQRLYETSETFAEMSERIEMDVSAETVRRYMIEADVHAPTSYGTDGTAGTDGETVDAAGADADGMEADADATGADADGMEADADATGADADATGADAKASTGDDDSEASTAAEPEQSAAGEEPVASLPDEQLVADGIGLPEELTVRDVVEAVVDARTVHEVQRELGLGYDRTRQLLTQFNVLDLVVGRVAEGSERRVTVDVVADRIRQSAPDAA